ncbi:MAG TPA: hypothetical protein VLT35_05690 [Methanocella sp.]|nr:hypothetical protein [Methanocella sp.]
MRSAGALACAVFIAALLAVLATGRASAAIAPVNGVDYSWLHHADNGDPVADWFKRIQDIAPVRNGDDLQFQNRWYNSYAGTVDLRISYGGEVTGTCSGADESVYYGLNYGNYYPSSTGAVPFYSTILSCNATPYYLMVTHQYVYNGIMYGTLDPMDKALCFQWRAQENDPRVIQTPTGTPTAKPTNTTPVPLPSATAKPSPGFDFGTVLLLAGLLGLVGGAANSVRKR